MTEHSIIGDRFELLEMIDQGGMGTVYRGRDTLTGDEIAIKALKSEIIEQEPTLIDRFKREGEALRQLNHPSIVKIIATLEQDSHYYIVMEYVAGGSVERTLRDGPLSVDRTLHIALDLADALTRAHRLKIIHRDIKPGNVLLAADGTPRLTDFGVAQVGGDRTKLTEIGTFVGTIAYLSPEIARGGAYDERSDIWAFGVMLYEMLSGKHPFIENNVATTLSAIMNKQVEALSRVRPDVPPELAYLIDRMIAKDPLDRISSVRAVGAELETIIAQVARAKVVEAKPTQEIDAEAESRFQHTGNQEVNSRPPESAPQAVPVTTAGRLTPEPPVTPVTSGQSSTSVEPGALAQPVMPMTPGTPAPGGTRPTAPTPGGSMGRVIVDDRAALDSAPETARRPRIKGDPRVFVAYRREDTGEIARRIYDIFHRELGDTDVARDVDRVANRTINRVVLAQDIVASFDAMVVVIGPQFITMQGASLSGKPITLFNPKDPVRIQLEAGLKRDDMLIIPLLVENTPLPHVDQLPPSLQAIASKTPFSLAWTPAQGPDALEAEIRKLIRQIRGHFNPQRPRWLIPAVIGAATAAILVVLALVASGGTPPALVLPLAGM
ncbi:MAG: protein kinase [bacterium]|nr:protein kinase [bacterium]